MTEFKIPKQVASDLDGGNFLPSSEDYETPPEEFQIPNQAIRELGQTAGDIGNATELLGPSEDEESSGASVIDENTDIRLAKSIEARRASRDFSFTGGETSEVYGLLSKNQQEWALKVRDKLIETFEDKGISEASIGLLRTNPTNLAHPQTSNRDVFYMAHLGAPLQDVIIMSSDNGRLTGHSWVSKKTTQEWFRKKRRVVNLADTPAFDPKVLTLSMGKTALYWQELLPALDHRELWKELGMVWSPWAPTVNLLGDNE